MNEQLLEYFQRELQFLTEAGPEFARRHPEVAALLDPTQMPAPDPHMERMIQAFALLNSRIHLHLDRDLSQLTDALHSVVFPFAHRPIPSCAVVRLLPPAGRQSASAGDGPTIPRGTLIESDPIGGLRCRFRTCYPVTLLPVELRAARLERLTAGAAPDVAPQARSVLRLRFDASDSADVSFRGTSRLRMFLQAPRHTSFPLYELLVHDSVGISVSGANGQTAQVPGPGLIEGVGFRSDETLLPWPPGSPAGHRLLLEFFAFPEKYLFLDVCGLDQPAASDLGRSAELLIYLNRSHRELENHVSDDTLLLHCTPVVNLFHQRAEPISLDHEQTGYSVRPDVRFRDGLEPYSIDRVTAISNDRSVEVPALYEPGRYGRDRFRQAVWTASRRQQHAGDDSTGFQLNVADPLGELLEDDEWTLDVEITALNGELPAALPFHGRGPRLRFRDKECVEVECIVAPTHRRPPLTLQHGHRKLVSLLALQSLPLLCEDSERSHLQDVLALCDPTHSHESQAIVEGVVRSRAKQVLEEISVGTARCTCHGIEAEIELDESRFPGGSAFLFAGVLERFLSVSCSMNCFTRLVIRSTETQKTLYRFPARVAEQTLASVS